MVVISHDYADIRGEWEGVTIDSLEFHLSPPCPTLLGPARRPHVGRPQAVFYPFGHPKPYAHGRH
jgi:hypothetical protein